MSVEQLGIEIEKFATEGKLNSKSYTHILNFMIFTMNILKDQSDEIANLRQELAKKMKEMDQKESYYPKKRRRSIYKNRGN